MAKNIHREPFDDGTLLKLDIFKGYLQSWLPVFVAKNELIWKKVNVFDFFAGPGRDVNGQKGSPLIIVEELISAEFNGKPFNSYLEEKDIKVTFFFNEFDKDKHESLELNLRDFSFPSKSELIIHNKDFKNSFENAKPLIKDSQSANLLFLDQNGIKQIDPEVFDFIISQKATDFIFYISSSYINRFSEHPSFKKYLQISKTDFEGRPYHHCHKVVLDYYTSLVPQRKNYFLAPFSIKKGNNIYGLIFGSNHSLGIEKFLRICWTIDPQRGEANFDIDEDNIKPDQPYMFEEFNRPKKLKAFEEELKKVILASPSSTLKSVYSFGLSRGFLPKHVNNVIKGLVSTNKVLPVKGLVSQDIHRISDSVLLELKK